MRTICIKTRVKAQSIEDIRIWFKTIKKRMNETLKTLENEGVFVESAFLDKQGGDYFLIYYLKAKNIKKAYEIFDKSTSPIDLYFKDCWKKYCEGREVLEELMDIDLIGSINHD